MGERKKAEQLREERRKEEKRRNISKSRLKDADKAKKSKKRDSSDEESSSESKKVIRNPQAQVNQNLIHLIVTVMILTMNKGGGRVKTKVLIKLWLPKKKIIV